MERSPEKWYCEYGENTGWHLKFKFHLLDEQLTSASKCVATTMSVALETRFDLSVSTLNCPFEIVRHGNFIARLRHYIMTLFFDSIYEPVIALLPNSGNCSGFNFIIAFNCLEQRSYAFNVLILILWFSYASMPNHIIHNLYSLRIIKLISVK